MARETNIKAYMEAFERTRGDLPGAGLAWVEDGRAAAIEAFAGLGLPTQKLEDWKYTALPALGTRDQAAASLAVDGADQDGLHILSLRDAMVHEPERIQTLFEQKTDGDALFYLNRALASDGLVIRVEKGCKIQNPVTIRHHTQGASHIHHLILLEADSALSVIEKFTGGKNSGWTNPAIMIEIAQSAALHHYKHQDEGRQAVHTAQTAIRIAKGGLYDRFSFFTGGAIARDDVRVRLEGEDAALSLRGLSLCGSGQSHDLITRTDHVIPHTKSEQAFRGVLSAGAKAAFQGKVIVRQDAQKTDATQSFRNLLLDRTAEVNTKPELEIYADDVKCAHGATVGELDENALFYLESRGVAPEEARAILAEAFVTDLFAAIANESVRDDFMAQARTWMAHAMIGEAAK